jgi:hypothetical protein
MEAHDLNPHIAFRVEVGVDGGEPAVLPVV